MRTLLARLARLVRGTVAGLIGTLAMDLLWWRRYRAGGGGDGFADWEFSTGVASFDDASAPGQVGRRLARVLAVDLPDEVAGTTTNVMHWLTGAAATGLAHAALSDGSEA